MENSKMPLKRLGWNEADVEILTPANRTEAHPKQKKIERAAQR